MEYSTIISAIRRWFHDHKYFVSNTYIFRGQWESDGFSLSPAGMAYEFEIKVSRSDFRADFKKKEKHRILDQYKSGWVIDRGGMHCRREKGIEVYYTNISLTKVQEAKIPNRFFYVCPWDIIPIDQVPHYAGLIYVDEDGRAKVMKNGPLLHNGRLDYAKILIDKFYYKTLKQEQEIQSLRTQLKYLKQ